MALRNSGRFAAFTTACGLLLLAFCLHAASNGTSAAAPLNRILVKELHLTDICLFTEARYTRNPALADHHAPFQEHPGAFEHFPSGSLLQPAKSAPGTSHAEH